MKMLTQEQRDLRDSPLGLTLGLYRPLILQPNSEARRMAEIARPKTRSGCKRGAVKPNAPTSSRKCHAE